MQQPHRRPESEFTSANFSLHTFLSLFPRPLQNCVSEACSAVITSALPVSLEGQFAPSTAQLASTVLLGRVVLEVTAPAISNL